MNDSKVESSSLENKKSKEKNIREIYLKAVKNNKGFQRRSKKKGISNLPKSNSDVNFGSASSSNYLEKEYNLVKRIISDTKELKTHKTKSDSSSKSEQLTTNRPSTAPTNTYKTPEEYSRELLELKKALKIYQNDEVVNKAKFEYYDNELSKKEQEIIELLDNKKTEELRLNAESKSELTAANVYNLKQKAYKLEFSLKRKENELNKLKNELKTTNLKELQTHNDRLRIELSKALMNDKRIIEAFEKDGLIEKNGYSYYDSERRKNESELSLHKKEKLKQNIAKQLSEDGYQDEDQFRAALKDFKRKMILKGTLSQKLEIMDLRENELLKEIERLNEALETKSKEEKVKISGSMSSLKKESRDNSPSGRHRSADKIQSVLRGHFERVNSLNRNDRRPHGSFSGSSDSDSFRGPPRDRSLSPPPNDKRRPHNPRQSPLIEPPRYKNRPPQPISSSDLSARSDNSEQTLINETKNVSEVESKGGCCSSFRSKKKNK